MALRWYQATLARRPVITQAVTSGILFAAGDVISQQLIEKKGEGHDVKRTLRMLGYGGLLFGPAIVQWYRVLDKVRIARYPLLQVPAKMLADQAVFPPIHLAIFFSTMAYFDGESPKKRVEEAWWRTLKTNWTVWPGIQLINFAFVPLQHRVMVVNVVALGWNAYLAYSNVRAEEAVEAKEE